MVVRWLTWGGLTTDGTGWERIGGGCDAICVGGVAGGGKPQRYCLEKVAEVISRVLSRSITSPLPWEFWTSACGDSTPCLHRLKVHLCFGCHGVSS